MTLYEVVAHEGDISAQMEEHLYPNENHSHLEDNLVSCGTLFLHVHNLQQTPLSNLFHILFLNQESIFLVSFHDLMAASLFYLSP